MENNSEENKPKVPDNEGYDPENPQKQNLPEYNSSTSHRDSGSLPAVENLNQTKELKSVADSPKKVDSDPSSPANDESLYGKKTKTDLGGGQRDQDEDEDEKIIRT